MICRICNNILPSRPRYSYRWDFQLEELQASAQSCDLCLILLSAVQSTNLEGISKISIQNHSNGDHEMSFGSGRTISVYNLNKLTPPQQIQLLSTSASFSESTGSNAAFEWALTQYKNCIATHSTCPNQTVAKLPARVLALGDLETGLLDLTANVRIHESIDEQNTYACLSHCWGGYLPIKLTKENLASFRNNIPWSALPKSFQDAIAFTRKLRIPYIWIDSLCIIQDDKEDWREQSAQMAGIYENSAITLAASAAENGAAGCFLRPSPTTVGYVTDGSNLHLLRDKIGVYKFLSITQEQQASLSVSNHPKILIKEHPWHPDLDATDAQDKEHIPLFSRGWAYQERILAPKVLHFGPQELFWECNNGASCECGELRASPKAAHQRALQSSLNSVLSYRWRDIVSEYTSKELTYTSDKLPAIAGIAKQFMGRMELPNYLAGLWGQSLVKDMMWRVDSPSVWTNEWRAPSWSWASALGSIVYRQDDESTQTEPDPDLVQILEASCISDGPDNFVSCISGHVVLRGHLAKVRLQNFVTKDQGGGTITEKDNFGITNLSSKNFYKFFLDFLPRLDGSWKSKEPVWPSPPLNWNRANLLDRNAPANNDTAVLEYQHSELRLFQQHFIRYLEREDDTWCLLLSMQKNRTCFLVLGRIASQTFQRLGFGWYGLMKPPLFDINENKQTIRLI